MVELAISIASSSSLVGKSPKSIARRLRASARTSWAAAACGRRRPGGKFLGPILLAQRAVVKYLSRGKRLVSVRGEVLRHVTQSLERRDGADAGRQAGKFRLWKPKPS